MKLSVFSLFFVIFTTLSSMAKAVEEITFSGGLPIDDYQSRLILPILTEAFKRHEIKFNARYYPSLRSLYLSNSGQVDGEMYRVYDFHKVSNNSFQNLIRIDSKLLSVWIAAFAIKKLNIETWQDLKGYKVAYLRGRKAFKKQLAPLLPANKIITVDTDLQAFKMLSSGRVDIVISESVQGNKMIADNPSFTNIAETGRLKEVKIYSNIHSRHRELAPKIANTLDEMKLDGSYSEIVGKAYIEFM